MMVVSLRTNGLRAVGAAAPSTGQPWLRSTSRGAGGRGAGVRRLSVTAAQKGDGPEVTVIGGGAAGLTAAWFAAEAGARVTVLERTREAGKKILMSGGSRCNILPVEASMDRDFFTEGKPAQLKAVFRSWPLEDCRTWLEDPSQVGLRLAVEEETNKYFPVSNSSKEVRDRLVEGCVRRGVDFKYGASVEGMERVGGDGEGGGWECALGEGGGVHRADRVVFATGGLSFPAVGTDGTGHRILRAQGHNLLETYPALTPLTGPHLGGEQLAGLSIYSLKMRSQVSGKKKPVEAERQGMLFTHRGYSGPSVLDLSHHAVKAIERGGDRPRVSVSWTGETREAWEARLSGGGQQQVISVLRKHLPNRLADAIAHEAGAEETQLAQLRKEQRAKLVEMLADYTLPYNGHQGYKKAEVTGGGVPLGEIDLSSMESRVLPGVHLCGEVCDVFGRIGGFNFYWAWVSGRLAGLGAAEASKGR